MDPDFSTDKIFAIMIMGLFLSCAVYGAIWLYQERKKRAEMYD